MQSIRTGIAETTKLSFLMLMAAA